MIKSGLRKTSNVTDGAAVTTMSPPITVTYLAVIKSFLEQITGADISKCMSEDAAGLVSRRAANYRPMQKSR